MKLKELKKHATLQVLLAGALATLQPARADLAVFDSREAFEVALTGQPLFVETFDHFRTDTPVNSSPVSLKVAPIRVSRGEHDLRQFSIETPPFTFGAGQYGIDFPPIEGSHLFAYASSPRNEGDEFQLDLPVHAGHFHGVGFDFSGAAGYLNAQPPIEVTVTCRITTADGSVTDVVMPDKDDSGVPVDDGFIGFFDSESPITSIAIFNSSLSATPNSYLEIYAIDNLTVSMLDGDGDGMPDLYEDANDLDKDIDDAEADADGDGLTNLAEFLAGLRAGSRDTDGDGVDDNVELTGATPSDPLSPDTDGDGLLDGEEIAFGTNPAAVDTDGDIVHDKWEVDNGSDPNKVSSTAFALQDLGAPTESWTELGALPSFDNYGDGLDTQDATFRAAIDFEPHAEKGSELIFETGGVRNGFSLTYEPGNRLVLRAVGNFVDLGVAETILSDALIAGGEVEVMWTFNVSNANGSQTIGLWLNGLPTAEAVASVGEDWTGPNAAAFGVSDSNAGGTYMQLELEVRNFTSGTINLTEGLQFFGGQLPILESTVPLRISEFRIIDESNVLLEWNSIVGNTYSVDESDDLKIWRELANRIEAKSLTASFMAMRDRGQCFYRVRETLPLEADFEDGADDWTSETVSGETTWELGLANGSPGDHVWGTNLHTDYSADAVANLRSPVVDLTNVRRVARLSFQYYLNTPDDEGGQLRFLDESGAVILRHEVLFTGTTEGWETFTLPLPQSLQHRRFIVEFAFLSNADDEVGTGWLIDDVVIR